MDHPQVAAWLNAYEQAWRSAGTDGLADLFTEDASYLASPWAKPKVGLEALAKFWDKERDGPDEEFTMTTTIVAVEADTAVVRVAVEYGNGSRWRDLWIIEFDADARCRAFEEWPFAPKKRDGH